MPQELPDICSRLDNIRERIRAAAAASGRKADAIRLIAVSKYMPAVRIEQAMACGQHCFGENTLQDALGKQTLLENPANEWHFIGHLQSNKARLIPANFTWLHTLDSLKLARRLSDSAVVAGTVLKTLLQVNVAADPDKFGLAPDALPTLVEQLLAEDLPGLELAGLMTIGRRHADLDETRRTFAALRGLGERCAADFGADHFHQLSMGMSQDFELAIAEGATMVRVGSAIFGPRPSSPAWP
jgi:pyridoxal phosphate enzyme (YggS family)